MTHPPNADLPPDEKLVRDAMVAYSRPRTESPADDPAAIMALSGLLGASEAAVAAVYEQPARLALWHRRTLAIRLRDRGASEQIEADETLGHALLASVSRIRAAFLASQQHRLLLQTLDSYRWSLPPDWRADRRAEESAALFANLCIPLFYEAALNKLRFVDHERPVPPLPQVPGAAQALFDQAKRWMQHAEYPELRNDGEEYR